MDLTPGEDQKRSDGPTCGMCHPPRLEDIDPNTTVYRCPEHQQMWDERIAPLLANIIQPRPWQPQRPIPMCSWGPGGREVVMVTDMAAWIDGQAAEVARGLQLPTALNSDGAPLAADFKTESLEGGE